jgi:hypothetical protein
MRRALDDDADKRAAQEQRERDREWDDPVSTDRTEQEGR